MVPILFLIPPYNIPDEIYHFFQTYSLSQFNTSLSKIYNNIIKSYRYEEEPDTSYANIKKLGYPVIVKPDNGVGASDTHKIKCEADLATFFGKKMLDL